MTGREARAAVNLPFLVFDLFVLERCMWDEHSGDERHRKSRNRVRMKLMCLLSLSIIVLLLLDAADVCRWGF